MRFSVGGLCHPPANLLTRRHWCPQPHTGRARAVEDERRKSQCDTAARVARVLMQNACTVEHKRRNQSARSDRAAAGRARVDARKLHCDGSEGNQ